MSGQSVFGDGLLSIRPVDQSPHVLLLSWIDVASDGDTFAVLASDDTQGARSSRSENGSRSLPTQSTERRKTSRCGFGPMLLRISQTI